MGKKCYKMRTLYIPSLWVEHLTETWRLFGHTDVWHQGDFETGFSLFRQSQFMIANRIRNFSQK